MDEYIRACAKKQVRVDPNTKSGKFCDGKRQDRTRYAMTRLRKRGQQAKLEDKLHTL
jgi:hypothetical protein